jgi:hypothetical protein
MVVVVVESECYAASIARFLIVIPSSSSYMYEC